MLSFLEVLQRAQTGPICKTKDWDIHVIPDKVKQKISDYGLKGTYDPSDPVNTDDKLADRYFEAGFSLALELGMHCLDTQRTIAYEEQELKDALRDHVQRISYGTRPDEVVIVARRPDDKHVPVVQFGPFAMPISEELWIPIHQSIAQHRIIDMLCPGTLGTIHGTEVRAGTPLEVLAGRYEGRLSREAVRRAGRPNMALRGPQITPTSLGHLAGYGDPQGYRTTDMNVVLGIQELKTSYTLLEKVAHVLNLEAPVHTMSWSFLGAYAGPPEGVALASIAASILLIPTHQATTSAGSCFDSRVICNTGREAIWADSISGQAQARNMGRPIEGIISPINGPCTEMLLHECAAAALGGTVSGRAWLLGVRPRGGRLENYSTALENVFAAEIAKAAARLTRKDANEIVKELLPKYENRLRAPAEGKTFPECYDPIKLKPSKDWLEIYTAVRKELAGLGLPLDRYELNAMPPRRSVEGGGG
jgi:methylamine--corrinoid protein Co-methyltransferase